MVELATTGERDYGTRSGRALRRLPLSVEPAADESLWSWLHRLAVELRCPPGWVAKDLGLPLRDDPGGGVRVRFFGVYASTAVMEDVAFTSGLDSATIARMHLQRFHGSALDLTGLRYADERTLRRLVSREWMLAYSSRCCPKCLAERPGCWPVWWRLGYAACCPRHRVLLVDSCPTCGVPFNRGRLGHPRALSKAHIPDIGICGNHAGPRLCRQVLRDVATTPAPETIVTSQLRVLVLLQTNPQLRSGEVATVTGAPTFGPPRLAGTAVTAAEWFVAFRDIAALTLAAPPRREPMSQRKPPSATRGAAPEPDPDPIGQALTDAWLRAPRQGSADGFRASPATATLAAAFHREAQPIMAATTRDVFLASLEPLAVRYEAEQRRRGFDMLRVRPPTGVVAAGLQRLTNRRNGRIAGHAPRHAPPAAQTAHQVTSARLTRQIPRLMPPPLYGALSPYLPKTAAVTGRRFSSLSAARLVGASSWAEAARLLGVDQARGRRTAEVVAQRITDPEGFWAGVRDAVDALIAYDCDFRALEHALADFDEIPPKSWVEWSHRHGCLATPQRARHAAAWSWATHAAAEWTTAPAAHRPWPGTATRESRVDGYRRFVTCAPGALKAELLIWTQARYALPPATGAELAQGVLPGGFS